MTSGIVILGSGFAARQLVKNIRKQDAQVPLTLIAADSIDEYNKPDLSHVISRDQQAEDLTLQTAGDFAEQYNLRLFPNTWITEIDPQAQKVKSVDQSWRYDKLVLATGARTAIPPIVGKELLLTLNSQQEYAAARRGLCDARRILILGGGLIGCELAMDFLSAGKAVTVVDSSASLLASLMPPEVSSRLQHCLTQNGAELRLNRQVQALTQSSTGIQVTLNTEQLFDVDAVVAATGLRPETALAQRAGITVNRGIVVNAQLQTSDPHIYALGDCAEIKRRLLPFLQPILLSSLTLAKTLLGDTAELKLPPMLVKIKTPLLPLQLAGETQRDDLEWTLASSAEGMVAKGTDRDGKLRGFVVSEGRMKEAFTLLKLL
ncbi:NADH:flavorubredoxin reductase NorW [Scandinavium sp. NPDC088450]|uniref:NADH:flavorubredoxin reductase NorW n=1 Tax=Scandinavium sp. NPDC088450 TaxID=3364514 RepID=UPI00384B6BCD